MLNSWSDDWCGTTATKPSTDKMPTIEDIRRAMREFQEKWKDVDLGPDVWVLTHDEFQELKRLCEQRDPSGGGFGGALQDPSTIYGIRIEEYATKQEVRARVLELADKGVKAGFLVDEVEPCCSD